MKFDILILGCIKRIFLKQNHDSILCIDENKKKKKKKKKRNILVCIYNVTLTGTKLSFKIYNYSKVIENQIK